MVRPAADAAADAASASWASNGGRSAPTSVTIADTSDAGTMSTDGLAAAAPSGAIRRPANVRSSQAGRGSVARASPSAAPGSWAASGAATTNGIACRSATTASP